MITMSLEEFSASLDGELKQVILNSPSSKEPQIINDYIGKIKQAFRKNGPYLIQLSPTTAYYLDIKAKVVHQKPYALFDPNNGPCGRKKLELGDILFVVKYVHPLMELIEMRASFLQAKLTKKDTWKITAHQQEFLMNPNKYKFKFGKKWGKKYQERQITSKSKWLFTYLLMSNQFPNLAASPEIVELWRQISCKDYPIPADFFVPVFYSKTPTFSGITWYNRFVGGRYALWLYKFLKMQGIGGYLINNRHLSNRELKDLVDTIYRFVGLQPDPPDEFEGYYEEGTFGVVEFTFTPTEERDVGRLW